MTGQQSEFNQGSNALNISDELRSSLLADATEHIKLLYRDTKGKVVIAQKEQDSRFKQQFFIPKTVINKIDEYIGRNNVFISQNTFFKNSRKIEDIKNLCALYADIDCYRKGYTKEQVIWQLEKDYYNSTLPIPNLTIDSGKGIYLIWLIRPVPPKAMPLWAFTQKYFYGILSDFGADSKSLDAARILRLSGTYNDKSNSMVQILSQYDYSYTLNEIQEDYLPKIIRNNKPKSKTKKTIVHAYNLYTLHYQRLLDLKEIVSLRNGDMTGCREFSLFLYRYWNCLYTYDPDKALQDTLDLNNSFTQPLREKTVIRDTRSAERAWEGKLRHYNYSNESIINGLNISDKEMAHLSTIISKEEKYRRKNIKRRDTRRDDEGMTSREAQKAQKIESIRKMLEIDLFMKQADIAEKLNISPQIVSDYIKIIKSGINLHLSGEMGL